MAEKILLLGHDKDAGMKLARVLSDCGYRPLAGSWKGFSPRAFGRNDRPRMILADVDRPTARPMAEFSREMRLLWGDAYPIVAVTAASKFGHISALIDAGATDCLPKKASSELLKRKIKRCLDSLARPAEDEMAEDVSDNLANLFAFAASPALVRLGDLVDAHAGATPRMPTYRRMAPPDEGWRGVMTADVVGRFYAGKASSYLSWNRLHLFRVPSPEEYAVEEKVLLRRAGPPLAAAVDRSRLPAGTDVYSLVPREGVSAGYVACLLNSRLLDFYFNRLVKLSADGRLRLEAIRETPVPRPDGGINRELSRTATLLAHFGSNPQSWIDRQSRDQLLEEMENAVFGLYGADDGVRRELATLHF